METVTNIAVAASKAIWGESDPQETTDAANATVVPETRTEGTEPLSGELGDTKMGEPYDLGNLDSTTTDSTISNTTTTAHPNPSITSSPTNFGARSLDPSTTSSSTAFPAKKIADTHIAPLSSSTSDDNNSSETTSNSFRTTSEKPLISEKINPNLSSTSTTDTTPNKTAQKELDPQTSTTLPLRPEHQTEKTGVTDLHNPTLGTQTKDIKPSESKDHGAPGATSEVREHLNKDKGKGKDTDTDVDVNEDVDVSGPGPRTLEEIARENGGTVSASGSSANKLSSEANIQGEKDGNGSSKIGGDKEEGMEGSGEKYIKSTGVVAEGGDFDATRAGAGREADRLLGKEGKVEKSEKDNVAGEVAGEKPEGGRRSHSSREAEGEGEHGEGKKEGKLTHLKEKIKEKLHKH